MLTAQEVEDLTIATLASLRGSPTYEMLCKQIARAPSMAAEERKRWGDYRDAMVVKYGSPTTRGYAEDEGYD